MTLKPNDLDTQTLTQIMIKMYLYIENEIPDYCGSELQPEQKDRQTDRQTLVK